MDKFIKFKECYSKLDELLKEFESDEAMKSKEGKHSGSHLGETSYRVLHFKDNPVDRAIQKRRRDIEAIKLENDRLSSKLKLLEAGNSVQFTRSFDDIADSDRQIEMLTKKVDQLKKREVNILSSFKRTSREFCQVCYQLTGYRIEPLKDDIFRLSHMYAKNEEDKLYFEIQRSSIINLLENDYIDQYRNFMATYLEKANSFPAFLAAITLDLYKSSFQPADESINLSVDMSTTIVPNF